MASDMGGCILLTFLPNIRPGGVACGAVGDRPDRVARWETNVAVATGAANAVTLPAVLG